MMQAVQSILSIMSIIIVGYFLAYKHWFTEDTSKTLVRLVTQVSLPPLMLTYIMSNFSKEMLLESFSGLFIPFTSISITFLISIWVSNAIKVKKERLGLFKSMFFNANVIFMGLPINIAIFGEESITYVLLYYIANTTFFWTLGVYEISRDGNSSKEKIFSKGTLKKVLSPPLMGYITGVILVLLNIELPEFMLDTFRYLGNLATPIAMIFIGLTIYSINLKTVKLDKYVWWIFLGRFIISPMIVIIMCRIFPVPSLMSKVFVMQSAMPIMTNSSIIAKSYGADHEYAAVMSALTTIASLFVIPAYATLLN